MIFPLNSDLENTEDSHGAEDEKPNFEVDSIELATPQLFSEETEIGSIDNDNKEKENLKIFETSELLENTETTKEPEMFEKQDTEEDLEIPAFLRRQRN